MAVGPARTYCMYISFIGAMYFFFIAICCFIGLEALHLPKGKNATRGFQVFLSSIIYGAIGGWIYYQKYLKDAPSESYNQDGQMTEMRTRLIQDY